MAAEAATGKGIAVGLDPASVSRIAHQLRFYKSALLARASGLAQREKVVGLLQGFDGELVYAPFCYDPGFPVF